MEGALRQLGGYLKAARKFSRTAAGDYSRVNEEEGERIVEMVDMLRTDEEEEDSEVMIAATAAANKTKTAGNMLSGVSPGPKDDKQELIDETLAALRSLDELADRTASVRQENRLLRKARRTMQRRPLDSPSSAPLIASP